MIFEVKWMNSKRQIWTSLLFASLITPAQAEICYTPDGYVDVFTLSGSTSSSGNDTVIFGNEYALEVSGTTARYSLPVVGSLEPVPLSNPAISRLGLHGVNVSTHWGNHSDCTFAFDVNPVTLAPAPPPATPLVVSCVGNTAGIYNISASIAQVDCNTISSAHSSAKAAVANRNMTLRTLGN
jgi:hypothetical protein